jgi:hypothetical protein
MAVAAPNSDEIASRLNRLRVSATRCIDPSDMRLVRIRRRAQLLLEADAAAAYSILSGAAALAETVP